MARSYHTPPHWPDSALIYVATTSSERQALKRRGWTKQRAEHMPRLINDAMPARNVGGPLFKQITAHYHTGTWFIATPLAHEGDDRTQYRAVLEGSHTPKDF